LKEYEKVYKKLLSQLDKIGNEIIKSLDKDKEYFDMDKYREYLQSTKK
jgi:hypothetical protein